MSYARSPYPSHIEVALWPRSKDRPVAVRARVAWTPEERARGLQGVKHLPAGSGLLIAYAYPAIQSLWMKDVLIPLDMLFMSPSGTVIGVFHSVPAGSTESRKIDSPSQFVLEVPAGFAKAHRIDVGSETAFTNTEIG